MQYDEASVKKVKLSQSHPLIFVSILLDKQMQRALLNAERKIQETAYRLPHSLPPQAAKQNSFNNYSGPVCYPGNI